MSWADALTLPKNPLSPGNIPKDQRELCFISLWSEDLQKFSLFVMVTEKLSPQTDNSF